ncbi:MAG: hypothetical protein ACP5US_00015 [Candidatus Kryptoniota bacterium]
MKLQLFKEAGYDREGKTKIFLAIAFIKTHGENLIVYHRIIGLPDFAKIAYQKQPLRARLHQT